MPGLDLAALSRQMGKHRDKGTLTIASAKHIVEEHEFSAVSLLFAPNGRPTVAAINALARETGHYAISHNPQEDTDDTGQSDDIWLELNAMGLTFDLTGLAPGQPRAVPKAVHRYGLARDFEPSHFEVVTLAPGPHLQGGGLMFPVVRCLAWLGALLSQLPGIEAVAWHPARSFNEPVYFRTSVLAWIEGGAFPGLGLTSLSPTKAGGLISQGLSIFIGQELELVPELVPDKTEGMKIALRLLHWMVENGRVTEAQLLTGPSGEPLRLEPVRGGDIVKVLRNAH